MGIALKKHQWNISMKYNNCNNVIPFPAQFGQSKWNMAAFVHYVVAIHNSHQPAPHTVCLLREVPLEKREGAGLIAIYSMLTSNALKGYILWLLLADYNTTT